MSRGHGKAPTQRQLRVGEELRHAIAQILERGHIRDPELANRPITITEVRVSPDLRNATVYVMPLGGNDLEVVLKALKRVRGFMRHELARAVRLQFAPDLWFEADTSFETATRIETLLRSPEVRRDVDALVIDDLGEDESPDRDEGRNDGE